VPGAPAASAPPTSTAAAPAAAAPLPACPDATPLVQAAAPAAPPTIGQQFTGGGMVAGQGTAGAVTVVVVGGPLAGSRPLLAITPDTKVFVSGGTPNAPDVATTGDQLHEGEAVKFSATRTGASTYVLDEIHAAPVGAVGGQAAKAGAAAQPATPPPVGGSFKAGGVALSSTSGTVTVSVDHGNLTGTVTFTLDCTLGQSLAGDTVDVAGTRTGPSTYDAKQLDVSRAPVNP
jgi:hypothetical protein